MNTNSVVWKSLLTHNKNYYSLKKKKNFKYDHTHVENFKGSLDIKLNEPITCFLFLFFGQAHHMFSDDWWVWQLANYNLEYT